jgi:hypothetical protein
MLIFRVILVPDGTSGKCLGTGIQGVALGKDVCGGDEQPKPGLPSLNPLKGGRRDPAAMEETCAKSSSYSFKT